ncbi:MAG: hypothetical protein GY936_08015 [Ignavibacteriae bacterium]|nr:hypothetical protein [Ignavibacteriota bacterium]
MKKTFILLLVSLFVFYSCSSDSNPTDPTNNISTSDQIEVGEKTVEVSEDIGTGGGSIIISNSESVLNGLEITVPTEGYTETRNYIVSSAPITNHKFGSNFNPVSPMITIQNGGGYSEMPITIKVPVTKASDEFLIGFLYNEITGKLEALPVIELDDSFVTVETRHFALSSITDGGTLGKISETNIIGNLVISSLKETLFSGQSIISSGFTPGIDDWEFINYGSYISPSGHCAGQSITAMWYYYEKRLKGEPPLFHRFDQVNNSERPKLLWQDNALGYRFASTVQEDAEWGNWVRALKFQSIFHNIVWKTFIAAMLITGEPQSVIIRNSLTKSGHAMIIYKINLSEGKLYVADPNYPNNRASNGDLTVRTISYSNNRFEPYPSFAKVGDPRVDFDQIAFYSKTSVFDWTKISNRYKELEDKTIGNDRFLSYNLFVKNGATSISFLDQMTVTNDTLNIFCRNNKIPGFLPGTDRLQAVYLYDNSGNLIAAPNESGLVSLPLSVGENKFGIYVCGYKNNIKYKYYDYKWVTVNYQSSDPGPNDLKYNRCIVGAQILANIHSTIDNVDSTYTETMEVGSYSISGSFSGNTFTGETEQFGSKQTVSVTLNTAHDMVTSISFSSRNESSFNSGFVAEGFTGVNIPAYQNSTSYFELNGSDACNGITSINYTANNGGTALSTLQSYSCDDNSHVIISFMEE